MRLHRFFIKNKIEGDFLKVSDTKILDQWIKVLRYKAMDELTVFDGSGYDFDCRIEKIEKNEVLLRIIEKRKGLVLDKKITLFQSIIKKDKMEWVVEKATELGVSKIAPLLSERSEKKGFNLERARRIAIEASEQCGRSDVPEISEIINLEDCFAEKREGIIVFDPKGMTFDSGSINNHPTINIFIGPEGGWSDRELDMFKNLNIPICSLWLLVLRAETASLVALSKFV